MLLPGWAGERSRMGRSSTRPLKVMLASGADDDTVRIWSKEDKKVAPFDIPTLCLCHSASYIKDAATRREKENIGERHIGRGRRVKVMPQSEKVVRDESHYTDAEMLPIQDLFNSFSAGQAAELDDEEQLVVKEKKGKKWLEKRMGNVGKRSVPLAAYTRAKRHPVLTWCRVL
eukprot:25483-Rhodomonas_salina.2